MTREEITQLYEEAAHDYNVAVHEFNETRETGMKPLREAWERDSRPYFLKYIARCIEIEKKARAGNQPIQYSKCPKCGNETMLRHNNNDFCLGDKCGYTTWKYQSNIPLSVEPPGRTVIEYILGKYLTATPEEQSKLLLL